MGAWGYQPYNQRGIRFRPVEMRDIAIAMGVLLLAFSLVRTGGLLRLLDSGDWNTYSYALAMAGLAVPTGFLLHELMHKAVAQSYGCWAEFRMFPQGLVLAGITAVLGWLFAAPGAVVISGMVNRTQHRNISAAGPGTNLIIGSVFLGMGLIVGPSSAAFMPPFRYGNLILDVAGVNLGLAFFNMLPIGPLDGTKILATDRVVYGLMLAASVGLLVAYLRLVGVL